jgi:hypothetical protein
MNVCDTDVRISQARIALLEGERRSFDNVKVDLMRRIKMLEFALRMERFVFDYSKYTLFYF